MVTKSSKKPAISKPAQKKTRTATSKPSPASKPTQKTKSSSDSIPTWKKLKMARQKQFQKFNPRTQTQNMRRSFIGMRRGER